MALNDSTVPKVKGTIFKPHQLIANNTTLTSNKIPAGTKVVEVVGVANDADDFIVLPRLGTVQDGHEITILCNAGSNFELRTPDSSAEEINSEDCDGTKEYLCTDTQIVKVVKIDNTIGWMGYEYTAIGAKGTAVIPD